MANVANTLATGPTSKDAVSGGKQFPLDRQVSVGGNGFNLSTTSDDAKRSIMSMTMSSTGYSSNVEAGLKQNKVR